MLKRSAPWHVLPLFAQAVHVSTDPSQIGTTVARLLCEAFPICVLSLLQADTTGTGLIVLAQVGKPTGLSALSSGIGMEEDWSPLLPRTSRSREPFLLADLQAPESRERARLFAPFVDQDTHGCLCLPLWCGDVFEGLLIVGLTLPLLPESQDALVLINCGLHLASALSRARLQKRVHSGSHYLQAVLDQMPEGVIIAESASGQVRYANPLAATILGTTLAELIDAPLHMPAQAFQKTVDHLQPRSFWIFAVIRALAGETIEQMETVVCRPDGTQVPVRCSAAPLQTERGTPNGAILVLQDMTLQKHLEQHKNAFLALASHELRTPLTAVLGYADLIEKLLDNPDAAHQPNREELQRGAGQIVREAEHMAFLIEEMLDLSSLDHDQLTLHMGTYDVRALLTHVVEAQQQTSPRHQLRLLLDERTQAQGCLTSVDGTRLVQTFHNLVSNALKYSPQGGEIEVGLRQEGNPPTQICIWVADHGLGIAQEDLPHLFQRFYRSRKPDRAISGLGVGLYLVKQIIERHGGHIWVESTEGKGATFFVSLPLV